MFAYILSSADDPEKNLQQEWATTKEVIEIFPWIKPLIAGGGTDFKLEFTSQGEYIKIEWIST